MTVRICASVLASNMRDITRMTKKAISDGADFLEFRLDSIQGKYNPKDIRKLSTLPLIATNRPKREGGLFEGSEEERTRQLFSAAESGFEFIDIELSTESSKEIVKKMTKKGVKTIISSHIFDLTPNLTTLNSLLTREISTDASICKIVTSANLFEDNLRCLKLVESVSKKVNIVCFCMRELGITSRLLSPILGGYFTYAAVEKGKESASGQLTISEMRTFYEFLGA